MPKGRPIRLEAIERFLSFVTITENGCWEWHGSTSGWGYYGDFSIKGKSVSAPRWSYEYFKEPIPKGLFIDHTCHNADKSCRGGNSCPHRKCVNPDHLEVVTCKENIRRGWVDRHLRERKTHCPKGHPYDETNGYVYQGDVHKSFECKICHKETCRRHYLRKVQSMKLLTSSNHSIP